MRDFTAKKTQPLEAKFSLKKNGFVQNIICLCLKGLRKI